MFKRACSFILVCVSMVMCLGMPVRAAETSEIIPMEELTQEELNYLENGNAQTARATGCFDTSVAANSAVLLNLDVYLRAGETITYDGTYTPKNASVNFGFLAPDGKFYSVSGSNGSISTTIRVSQSGSYTLAIRNNSNQTVTVTGTVNY